MSTYIVNLVLLFPIHCLHGEIHNLKDTQFNLKLTFIITEFPQRTVVIIAAKITHKWLKNHQKQEILRMSAFLVMYTC